MAKNNWEFAKSWISPYICQHGWVSENGDCIPNCIRHIILNHHIARQDMNKICQLVNDIPFNLNWTPIKSTLNPNKSTLNPNKSTINPNEIHHKCHKSTIKITFQTTSAGLPSPPIFLVAHQRWSHSPWWWRWGSSPGRCLKESNRDITRVIIVI